MIHRRPLLPRGHSRSSTLAIALQKAQLAVDLESSNNLVAALQAYKETVDLLTQAMNRSVYQPEHPRIQLILDTYAERVRLLSITTYAGTHQINDNNNNDDSLSIIASNNQNLADSVKQDFVMKCKNLNENNENNENNQIIQLSQSNYTANNNDNPDSNGDDGVNNNNTPYSVMSHKSNNSISTINSYKSTRSDITAPVLIYGNGTYTTKSLVNSCDIDDSNSSHYSSSDIGSGYEETDSSMKQNIAGKNLSTTTPARIFKPPPPPKMVPPFASKSSNTHYASNSLNSLSTSPPPERFTTGFHMKSISDNISIRKPLPPNISTLPSIGKSKNDDKSHENSFPKQQNKSNYRNTLARLPKNQDISAMSLQINDNNYPRRSASNPGNPPYKNGSTSCLNDRPQLLASQSHTQIPTNPSTIWMNNIYSLSSPSLSSPPPSLPSHTVGVLNNETSPLSKSNDIGYSSCFTNPIHNPLFYKDVKSQNINEFGLLESPPNDIHLKPFWLIRLLEQTITTGGYLTKKLYIPPNLWLQGHSKLNALETKISSCDVVLNCILRLEKELESIDPIFEGLQNSLAKKLNYIESTNGKSWQNSSSFISWGSKLSRGLDRINVSNAMEDGNSYAGVLLRLFQKVRIVVRLFEKPKEPSNVANKTYSFSRTNKFNKNVPNKLNINTTSYNNVISTTNNKVNIDSSADITKPTKPISTPSTNTDTNSDIDISNIKNNTSSNSRERNSSSNKSNNFKKINSITITPINSKARPTSIVKDHSKAVSLDSSSENELKKLLSTTDINKINSKDLVKAATVIQASPTPSTASAAMVLLASKISALENELETVGKEMAENIKREVDLEFELDSVIIKKEEEIQAVTKPLVTRISQLEADLLQYKKSYSSTFSLDDISSSTRSSREHSDFFSEVNSPNSASTSINTTHNFMFYDKLLKDNINASNENYHDIESIKQELADKHFNELEKVKNELSEQFKKKEERIKVELKERFEIEKKELLGNYYNEKESIDFEENQKLKDQLDDKEKIETEFDQLKFEFDQINFEKDQIVIKFEGLNNKINELEHLNENLETLREEIESLRKRNKDLDELESSCNELKTKNEEFQAKNTKISSELFELTKELERIEVERQLLEEDIKDLNEEKSQLIDEKEELIKVVQTLEEEKLALKGDIVEAQGAHDKVADVLKFMKVEWENQYKNLRSEFIKSESRIKNLERQRELQGKMLDEQDIIIPNNESLYKNIYTYKQELEVLQQQLETSNKKISEKDDEQYNLIQTLEKTVMDCEAKFDTLKKDHQKALNSLRKQHEDEIKNITTEMQKKLELMEKKQRNTSSSNDNGNFEENKRQLELTKGEYDRLNEKLAQIQMEYLDAVHNKDQLIEEKHTAERKIKSLEIELEK
ncbi:2243_t:CDS:10, partial [Entrophospora sp. SA101]